jgi:hypothetical protein
MKNNSSELSQVVGALHVISTTSFRMAHDVAGHWCIRQVAVFGIFDAIPAMIASTQAMGALVESSDSKVEVFCGSC